VELIYEFIVAVTRLSSTTSGTNKTYSLGGGADDSSGSLPVLLDTGSAAWTVPMAVYKSLARLLPDMDQDGYLPCSSTSDDTTLTLTFGGQVNITVPILDFVVPVYDAVTNKQNTTAKGEPLCTFMIAPGETTSDQPFLTLGDVVLRSMYVVFDLDNGQVSIAQARTNTSTTAASSGSGDNIKVVRAGPNGVAEAVGTGAVRAPPSSVSASIAEAVSVTASFVAHTTAPAIGTATGTDAVPEDGRVTATTAQASSSSGKTSGKTSGTGSAAASAAASSSSGVASGLVMPGTAWSVVHCAAVALLGMSVGAALVA